MYWDLTHQLSNEVSDTFKKGERSFGVVLLELLTGKRALFHFEGEHIGIAQWVRPSHTTLHYFNVFSFIREHFWKLFSYRAIKYFDCC